MSYINEIQNKILELEGGAFQKLFDEYLYKRFGFNNIQTLGVQLGTNKPKKVFQTLMFRERMGNIS